MKAFSIFFLALLLLLQLGYFINPEPASAEHVFCAALFAAAAVIFSRNENQ